MTAAPRNLTVRELPAGDEARWDAFVDACPEATFFHRAGWRRVIADSMGHRTHYLVAEENGAVRGVLPLAHVKSRLFGNALISNAFGVYGGPAALDETARLALDRHAVELAGRLGVDYLEYRSRTRHFPDRDTKQLYVTFRKELDPDPNVNYMAIPRRQRAVIRDGMEANVQLRLDDDAELMWRLFAENVHRHGTPVYPRALFRNLKREFGDACEILIARHQGTDIAGTLTFYFRDEVMPYYAGGGGHLRKVGANEVMYWDLIRRATVNKYRIFDYGRSKIGTGPYNFKKNWGFKAQPLPYEFKLVNAAAVPDVNPLNPKYKMLIAAWKRMPLTLVNRLGPFISRNLG